MSHQLLTFLNALTDQGVSTIGEAADWLAQKSWQDSGDIARMIYLENNDSKVEDFDLKDLQHEFTKFRDSYEDDDANLETVVMNHW